MLTILWNQYFVPQVVPLFTRGVPATSTIDSDKWQQYREWQRMELARRDEVDLLEICSMITDSL